MKAPEWPTNTRETDPDELPDHVLARFTISREELPEDYTVPPEHDGATAISAGVESRINCTTVAELSVVLKMVQRLERLVRRELATVLAEEAVGDLLIDALSEAFGGLPEVPDEKTAEKVAAFEPDDWIPVTGDGQIRAKHKRCGETFGMMVALMGDHQQTCSAG